MIHNSCSKKIRIGIVGGGASGGLAAIRCRRELGDQAEILIFEPREELARGKAYSDCGPEHLLNVPAERMSADPDRPDDFVEWLRDQPKRAGWDTHWPFVPRSDFGTYLQERVRATGALHIRAQVQAIHPEPGAYVLSLSNGSSQSVDYVVIATGYRSRLQSPALAFPQERVLQPANLTHAHRGEILVLGSGLTAIDVWRSLRARPENKITFLSRRGQLPLPHRGLGPLPDFPQVTGMSPSELLCFLRSIGSPWEPIADSLRAQSGAIWNAWNPRQKAGFLRHLKPYWEVIRHRIPASIQKELEQDTAEGRLRVLAGRPRSARAEKDQIRVHYTDRRSRQERAILADWIVLATGSAVSQEIPSIPGLTACPFGFGYRSDGSERIWAIGPASKSEFWEITAVPEIRAQAVRIAQQIRATAASV